MCFHMGKIICNPKQLFIQPRFDNYKLSNCNVNVMTKEWVSNSSKESEKNAF